MSATFVPPAKPPPTIPSPTPVPLILTVGTAGETVQWVAFVIFLISTVAFIGLGSRYPKKNRAFHHITALITTIAALSYYAMATKTGFAFVSQGRKLVQGEEVMVLRQVYWARYVDWVLTTPLLLLDLGLLAGLPWADTLSVMAVDVLMIVTGLIAGLASASTPMWGWYAFSCIFLVYILYVLVFTGRKTARLQADHVSGLYNGLSLFTIALWIAYPIVFALTDGVGKVTPNVEAVIYGVLDILAKSGFGAWLIFMHSKAADDNHAASLPDSWTEPRSHHHRGIHLPGGDD